MLFRKGFNILLGTFLTAFLSVGCTVTTDLLGSASKSSTVTPISKTEYLAQFGVASSMFMLGGADSDSEGNLYVGGAVGGDYGTSIHIGTYDGVVAKYDNSGVLQWVSREGDAAAMVIGIRTRYADGFVYTVGYTTGSIASQTYSGGGSDLYVAKYNATTGARVWLRILGEASGATNGTDVRVDSSGNVFVCGSTSATLPGQSKFSTIDNFIAKYDSSGNRLWIKEVGESGTLLNTYAIGVDGTGNVYMAAIFAIGAFDGHSLVGTTDGLIIKFDSSGTKIWSRSVGSTASATVAFLDMAVDTNGNAYISGYTDNDLDGITHVGIKDQILIKFDANGNKQWTKLYGVGANNSLQALSVKLDSNNHVITAGGDHYSDVTTVGTPYGWTIIRWDATTGAQVDILHDTATGGGAAVSDFHIDSEGYVAATGMVWGALTGQTLTGVVDGFVMRKKFN